MSRFKELQTLFHSFKGYSDRGWYSFAIALLAALDNLIVIVPTDGILISSSVVNPKKWFRFSLFVTIGSTLGAIFLAYLVESQGLEVVQRFYPEILNSKTWTITESFFSQYGLMVVFLVAVTPFVQQPAVILASLAKIPILELFLVIIAGRFIKYLVMAYVGSHTPKYLKYLWGVQDEIKKTQ